MLSGIIFINRNGLRWCDAPREYGAPKTLYNRWKRWGDMGVFARMMEGLASEGTEQKTVMIDVSVPAQVPESASIARQHMQSMCERGTASSLRAKKGGPTTSAGV